MRIRRAVLAVIMFITASATLGGAAGGVPEGASSSIFDVDIVVRGTPPPGAEITVLIPEATFEDARSHTFALADAGGTTDIYTEVGTVSRQLWVDPADDAGAAGITYACTMEGGPVTEPFSTCSAHTTPHAAAPGAHVDASFNGNANAYARTTITLTFGTCDGRPATVLLADGDTPGPGRDVILGTPAGETINAHGGDDVVCGSGGNDVIRGGEGRDRVLGGGGGDRLEGGARGDTLLGGPGPDILLGLAGNDALDGGGQRDTCNGGTERDTGIRCEVRTAIP